MSSAALETQIAIYSILTADVTLSALITGVFDDVPESYDQFPYVTIGEDVLTEFDTDGNVGFRLSLTIHSWSRYKGQRETKLIQDAIYRALHHVALTVTDWTAVLARQVDQTSDRDPDGLTRHGVQTFEILLRGVVVIPVTSPLHPNLIAMYDMEGITGSLLTDRSVNGNDGTISGAVSAPGIVGVSAISFDGIDDFTDLGAALLPSNAADFAVCFWILGATPAGTIMSQYDPALAARTRFQLVTEGGGLTFQAGGGGTVATSNGLFGAGWDFVAITGTANTVSIYVNDVFRGSGTITGILDERTVLAARTGIDDGNPLSGLVNFLGTDLDQLRFFNRGLTTAEMTKLFGEGSP